MFIYTYVLRVYFCQPYFYSVKNLWEEQLKTTQRLFPPSQCPEQWGLQTHLAWWAAHPSVQKETAEQAQGVPACLQVPPSTPFLFEFSNSKTGQNTSQR